MFADHAMPQACAPATEDGLEEEARAVGPHKGKIALLVIEDHASLVDGMRSELTKDFTVTAVTTRDELRTTLEEQRFSLAVVDLVLHKKLEGLEIMPLLKEAGIKFLVFSGTVEDWHVLAAIRLGARGYVDKRKKMFVLRRALHTIANGGTAFPPEIMAKLSKHKKQKFPSLGPVEIEVINILMTAIDPETKGIPGNAFIRKKLDVSEGRVEAIFSSLYRKFKIPSSDRGALHTKLQDLGYFPGASLIPFDELDIKL